MRYLVAIILWALSLPILHASHIIGGNFRVEQTGQNSYAIDLTVFRDCGSQGNNTAQLQKVLQIVIFDQVTGATIGQIELTKTDSMYIALGDNCYTPTGLCVQEIHMRGTVSLVDNPNGYVISAQICCRNSVIDNIQAPANTGITWTAEIPDPALAQGNTSPDLGAYPPSGYFCLNYLRELDLEATDVNGDSLSYELIAPLNITAGTTPPPPPYTEVNWSSGYSTNSPINGSPSLNIDEATGLLRCKPNQLGEFVFAYRVNEYRNGIKIGSVQRDIQVQVLPCIIDLPPIFVEPLDEEFEFSVNRRSCIDILVVDSNFTDSVSLTSTVEVLMKNGTTTTPVTLNSNGIGSIEDETCWQPSCADAIAGQSVLITLKASSWGCNGISEAEKVLSFSLPPLANQILPLIPNVFTPNEDGINDVFQLTEKEIQLCAASLSIKIYNRWGTKVYESSLSGLSWDGNYEGQPIASGVYFYVLNGTYGQESLDIKHFITLAR